MLTKRLYVFALRASELELISSMRFDGRKNMQSVKSSWLICKKGLKPASYPFSRRIIKDAKQTHIHTLKGISSPSAIEGIE